MSEQYPYWRQGNQIPKNLYIQKGPDLHDSDDIGRMDTAELAETVVRAVNLYREDADGLVAENEQLRTQLAEVQRELNTWTRETGALIAEEGKRIADLIEREAYEDSMAVGESPPEIGSHQAGRDGGVAYGLRRAAEIARRG